MEKRKVAKQYIKEYKALKKLELTQRLLGAREYDVVNSGNVQQSQSDEETSVVDDNRFLKKWKQNFANALLQGGPERYSYLSHFMLTSKITDEEINFGRTVFLLNREPTYSQCNIELRELQQSVDSVEASLQERSEKKETSTKVPLKIHKTPQLVQKKTIDNRLKIAPRNTTPLENGVLTPEQEMRVDTLCRRSQVHTEIYLECHPEVEAIIHIFLRKVFADRPQDICKYARDLFNSKNIEIEINQYLLGRCVDRQKLRQKYNKLFPRTASTVEHKKRAKDFYEYFVNYGATPGQDHLRYTEHVHKHEKIEINDSFDGTAEWFHWHSNWEDHDDHNFMIIPMNPYLLYWRLSLLPGTLGLWLHIGHRRHSTAYNDSSVGKGTSFS